jgi:hypothetical protein
MKTHLMLLLFIIYKVYKVSTILRMYVQYIHTVFLLYKTGIQVTSMFITRNAELKQKLDSNIELYRRCGAVLYNFRVKFSSISDHVIRTLLIPISYNLTNN